MNTIIPSIEVLKTVVKINASLEDEVIAPYINDAMEIYIEPQVGSEVLKKATGDPSDGLTQKVRRCLGPLAIMLATPELGIHIGDSGITVANNPGTYSPANEAKIAAAKENFLFRGMSALDRLHDYLAKNSTTYPEYTKHLADTIGSQPCFIKNAKEYQDKGLVNIDYSTITYGIMMPTIRQLQERHVKEMITQELYDKLLANAELNPKEIIVFDYVVRYLANKTAELYTSQTSLNACALNEAPRFTAIIRPIYCDVAESGNYYASQANYYAAKISEFITANAEELGVKLPNTTLEFNSKEKKLFTSIY